MERKITNDVVTEIGLTQRNKILTLEGDVAVYDLRGMKKRISKYYDLKNQERCNRYSDIKSYISEHPKGYIRVSAL